MIRISITGNSAAVSKFYSALVHEFGAKNVTAELPDCMQYSSRIRKVSAVFSVNSKYFEKVFLLKPAFKNLEATVVVENELQMRKNRHGNVEITAPTPIKSRVLQDPAPGNYEECEEDVDIKLSDFEDLETYSERLHGYYRL